MNETLFDWLFVQSNGARAMVVVVVVLALAMWLVVNQLCYGKPRQ